MRVSTTQDFQSNRFRVIVLMIFCAILAAGLCFRAAYLQILPNSRLESMARKQFQSKVLIRPRRGAILDRNGEALAMNSEINSLAMNPQKIQNKTTLARMISKALGQVYGKLILKADDRREFTWIKRHLSENDLQQLRKWRILDFEGNLMFGFWLVKEAHRIYPHEHLASHVVGDVTIDLDGVEGVELWMNERLRGKLKSFQAIKDAFGRPAFFEALGSIHTAQFQESRDGDPITLTIDSPLQYEVEQELKAALKKTQAKAGTVIIMDADSGEILSLANEPTFSAHHGRPHPEARRNRAVTDGFEPGSILKPVLVASALSHGWRPHQLLWAENGSFKVQGKSISEAESHEKFGWLSLSEMIKVSSNIGAAKLALKLGADHYHQTLRLFGFGTKSQMGFPGEILGRLPPKKPTRPWQPLTLANMGFGHGLLVTPIQMIRSYASFLNGGILVQPRLLKENQILAASQSELTKIRRVMPFKVAQDITKILERVTEDGGTGVKARLPGYRVAGKTGTAQKIDPETATYSKTKYISSFLGFAVGVEPRLVIFVSLDEPKGQYYASETAAPFFRQILFAVTNRFSMPAKLNSSSIKLSSVKEVGPMIADSISRSPILDVPVVLEATEKKQWKMPSLRGLTSREALRILNPTEFHFNIQVFSIKQDARTYEPSGVILSHLPEAGNALAMGDTVQLNLAE